MQNSPLITIAVPFYNEEKYLRQTLQSLLKQTEKNIRIVLADNNSTDSSFAIASEFANTDTRIKLIKHEENIGAIENFVFTRDVSETKYFMWLGAHDCLKDEFIEEAVNYLEQNNDVVLYYPKACYFEVFESWLDDANSEIESSDSLPVNRMMKVVTKLYKCTALHGVFKLDILNKVPFDRRGVDNLLLFLIASHGQIKSSSTTNYYRRIVRKETKEEFIQRMKEFKIGISNNINLYRDEVYMVHFKYLHTLSHLTFSQKLQLIVALKDLFTYRFAHSFSWFSIFKYFITNFNIRVILLLLPANILNVLHNVKNKINKN
jgi:glycosyltransferase involved in cell wall biosynthesis